MNYVHDAHVFKYTRKNARALLRLNKDGCVVENELSMHLVYI
jgi:hypothetical protein